MQKIEKILACVDFSDYSLMTLETALAVGKGIGAEVIMYHVINQRDFEGVEKLSDYLPYRTSPKDPESQDTGRVKKAPNYLPYKVIDESYVATLKNDRKGMMETMIKEHFPDDAQRLRLRMDTGVPFDCILKAVETEGAELVVMANKGRGNMASILFGSSAEKVFRHCPVPVLSVRDKNNFKRSS